MFDYTEDFIESADEVAENARIAKRATFFCQAFDSYNEKLITSGLDSAVMNKALLLNAVESYFIDVRRIKKFHGMERIDRFKIASYTLKWLCNIRPIQVGVLGNLKPNLQKHGLLINADFALTQAFAVAGVRSVMIGKRLRSSLLYSAHYRDFDGGVMAVTMQTLAEMTAMRSALSAAQSAVGLNTGGN